MSRSASSVNRARRTAEGHEERGRDLHFAGMAAFTTA